MLENLKTLTTEQTIVGVISLCIMLGILIMPFLLKASNYHHKKNVEKDS